MRATWVLFTFFLLILGSVSYEIVCIRKWFVCVYFVRFNIYFPRWFLWFYLGLILRLILV